MRKNRGYHKFFVPFVFVTVLTVSLIANLSDTKDSVAADTACPNGISVVLGGTNNTATNLTGIVNVLVGASSSSISANSVGKIVILANNQPIGYALPSGTYSWTMPWVTSLHPNGGVSIVGQVNFTNGTRCNTPPLNANVQNATVSNLNLSVTPLEWQGPLSFSFPINSITSTSGVSFNPTPYALFQWSTNIGSLSPQHNIAQFSSGQSQGEGMVTLMVRYGGDTSTIEIPIGVNEPSAPLPDTPDDDGTTSDDDSSNTTTTNTINTTSTTQSTSTLAVNRPASIQNNPVTQACVQNVLGEGRYDQINNGQQRPTREELQKLNTCFATNNFILPSNFSPVIPTAVKDLPSNQKYIVNKLENAKKANDNGEIDVLKISGQAEPKSLVLIYIFSEPLIFTTTADDLGNWTYTLEDPIEPGSHEVYSVVDRGDGVYERSNPLSFVIGTAEAAENNPNGLSLRLAETATPAETKRSMIWYIVGVTVLLLVVVVGFLFIINKRRSKLNLGVPTEFGSIESQPTLTEVPDDHTKVSIEPQPETSIQPQNDQQPTQNIEQPSPNSENQQNNPS